MLARQILGDLSSVNLQPVWQVQMIAFFSSYLFHLSTGYMTFH